MPAIGLTHKAQESAESRFLAAKIYLGKRQEKKTIQRNDQAVTIDVLAKDADLKNCFRIQPLTHQIRQILQQAYGIEKPDPNGDLLVESLNIVPISHDPDRTFPVWYKSYIAKKPLYICDRRRIHQEWKDYKDRYGHQRGALVQCNKVCPMADESNPWIDCPNGCKPSGVLHFYIKELIDARLELPCQLTVVGKTNFQEGGLFDQWKVISDRFPDTLDTFWSQAIPFPCGSYILCKLSRIEVDILRPQLDFNNKITREVNGKTVSEPRRTGEKAKGKAYPLFLSVDPFWEATYFNWKRQKQSWKQIQEIRSAGFLPSRELLEMAQVETIEAQVIESSDRFLPPGQPITDFLESVEEDSLLTEEQLQQLRIVLATSWKTIWRSDRALFLAALQRNFNVADVKELHQSQFEAVKEFLANGEF